MPGTRTQRKSWFSALKTLATRVLNQHRTTGSVEGAEKHQTGRMRITARHKKTRMSCTQNSGSQAVQDRTEDKKLEIGVTRGEFEMFIRCK